MPKVKIKKKCTKDNTSPDLSKYIDSVEVDVASFEDYHALRRELMAKR